jgi:hypothetical protein
MPVTEPLTVLAKGVIIQALCAVVRACGYAHICPV